MPLIEIIRVAIKFVIDNFIKNNVILTLTMITIHNKHINKIIKNIFVLPKTVKFYI